MGTSNSNRGTGPNTPLVPTWLTPGGTPPAPPPLIPPESDPIHLPDNLLPPPRTAGENSPRIPTPLENLPIPPNGNANRFRGPRSNFTKFISSGGGDRRSMGRALAGYVSKSSGGSRNATLGMGSSRSTTAILLNFFSSVQSQGAAPTLRALSLGNLVGTPIVDVFSSLVEYFCPAGGNIDEGIARSAFIDTMAEVVEAGIVDFDTLTSDQMLTFIETFITNAIEQRVCNDIGIKMSIAAEDLNQFDQAHDVLHEFIQGCVRDALTAENLNIHNISPENAIEIGDRIYETAFNIIEQLAENE